MRGSWAGNWTPPRRDSCPPSEAYARLTPAMRGDSSEGLVAGQPGSLQAPFFSSDDFGGLARTVGPALEIFDDVRVAGPPGRRLLLFRTALRGSDVLVSWACSTRESCARADHKSTINILFLLKYLANLAPESRLMEPAPRTDVE